MIIFQAILLLILQSVYSQYNGMCKFYGDPYLVVFNSVSPVNIMTLGDLVLFDSKAGHKVIAHTENCHYDAYLMITRVCIQYVTVNGAIVATKDSVANSFGTVSDWDWSTNIGVIRAYAHES